MNPIKWIKKLFGRPVQPIQVDHADPLGREVIARCWNTGNIVIGTREDDGSIKIEEFMDGRQSN